MGTKIIAVGLCAFMAACGPETTGYPPPQGFDAGLGGAAGGQGTTSTSTGGDATGTAPPMPAPCMDTGGTTITQQCCETVGDWPGTCSPPECGSAAQCDGGPAVTTLLCDCQLGRCYDAALGCVDVP